MSLQRFREAVQTVEGNTFFYTHDYDITAIPDDVKHLRTVAQIVHITNCFQLRSLSSCIGDLSMLRWLDLSYNGLVELPSAVGRLRHLERLHCNNNRLTSLPIELWGLKGLEELRVDSNQLQTLPTAAVLFTRLREFHCENNPFVRESDVNGAEISEMFPIPAAGDCSNCQGRFGKPSECFVTFHSICGSVKVPSLHICCSVVCKEQLAGRLSE